VCQNQKCVGSTAAVAKSTTVADSNGKMNLTEYCVKRTGYAQASVSDSMLPTEYCKILKCDWMKDGKPKVRTVGENWAPPDNAYPCGYDGV